jgi:beta-lactamase superfamily II metal-dependent hydrolase
MMYNGFEIDMLSLGNADCILVTQWTNGLPERVLIDGGNSSSVDTVLPFLLARSVERLDHVVCTHPHDDHAAGLAELLEISNIDVGCMWMHIPQFHLDMQLVESALEGAGGLKRAEVIRESLETVNSLYSICQSKSIPIVEPFAGDQIGFLTVVGPTREYYEELVCQFSDLKAIQESESLISSSQPLFERLEDLMDEGLLSDPKTQPENDSSVILATQQTSGLYLFTADAGVDALCRAASSYDLQGCHWMQIPHHGSRRNINEVLITHFAPKVAYVSARGSRKHPREVVVNAFKNVGTVVYSTHYPKSTSLHHHRGNVPQRTGYSAATPLYEART